MVSKRIDLETIGHLIAAAVLLLKGYDKLGHGHLGIGLTLLVSGALVLAFLVYTMRTGRGHRFASAAVFAFEALAMTLIAYLYFGEGKRYVQYATLAAAAMCLVASVRMLTRRNHSEGSAP